MVPRLIFALFASFLLSGCCELFGICTSVNVHTSLDKPYQVANEEKPGGPAQLNLVESRAENMAGLDGPALPLP
jgi:hypothetical protein